MAGVRKPQLIASMTEKYGSYEAYCEHMSTIGRKGGSRKVRKGYAVRRDLVVAHARLGGKAGKRQYPPSQRNGI